jgi:hypothetical protein
MTILHNCKLQNWNLQMHICEFAKFQMQKSTYKYFCNLINCACYKLQNYKIVNLKY